jgi:tetratricopeptide (TPR) repeat protein
LARVYALNGDRSKAQGLVEQILKEDKNDVEAQLINAQFLLDDGKRDAALEALRAVVGANPSSAEAHFALGQIYSFRGDIAAAKSAFEQVIAINPRVVAAQVELARLQLSSGDSAGSVRTAEAATTAQPSSLAARLSLIRGLLASNDLARADREIAELRRALPEAPEVQVQVGALAALRNDTGGARLAFERALALNANSIEAAAGLISLDLTARNFSAAKARVDKLVGSGTPRADLLLLAARAYGAADDLAGAERFLRRAVQVEPTMLPAYAMLAQLYMAQGNLAQAKKRFEEVLAMDPGATIAANNLAWMYADSGENLDAALQLAQIATAGLPDSPQLMDTLGYVYLKKKLPQLAIPQFSRSVEKEPKNAIYLLHLGMAYLDSGDIERGRNALQRALDAKPDAATTAQIQTLLARNPGPLASR